MTVPDPLSLHCEKRRCSGCDGVAVDHLRDEHVPCRCSCHRKGHR